jgi:hypothetical protein
VGGAAEPGLCYDARRQRLVAFGGWDSANKYSATLWEWTGSEFLTPVASGPSARAGHAFVYDPTRERCLLFGGRGDAGLLADTWEWDGEAWRRLDVSGPSPRWFFGAAADVERSRIVIFGGSSDGGDLGDTWSWTGDRWTLLTGDGPLPRGMAKLASNGRTVLLFGGRTERAVQTFLDVSDSWVLADGHWRRVR